MSFHTNNRQNSNYDHQITCGRRSFACFSGKHTGQSLRGQFRQWLMICRELEQ